MRLISFRKFIKKKIYVNMKLIIFIFISIFLKYALLKDCFWNSDCLYRYFSSKSSYSSVRGDIRDSFVKLKGCEPVSVWALIRHGKRSPGVGFSRNMKNIMVIRDSLTENFEKGASSLCAQDIDNLKAWQYDTDLFERDHGLTVEGRQELFAIGRRLREALSKLLGDLKDGSYIIRSAYGQWIEDGVESFVNGLSNKYLDVQNAIPEYDIMAPYDNCQKYLTEIKHNPNIYFEAEKYEKTAEFVAAKERVQQRMGIDFELTSDNLTSLYDICRYSWGGIDNRPSPWCALFTLEDLLVMEYHGDLRHYYRNGYGNAMNRIFGRIPMADLYTSFNRFVHGDGKVLTAYFSHATMMDMVYCALGWHRDDVPLTSAYRDPNRKWRSSTMSAFSANLIAVLYRCYDEGKEQFKVILYNNEEPVTSICERGACSWHEFENMFRHFLNTSLDFCST